MAGIRRVVAGGLLATVVLVGAGCGGQSTSSVAAPTGVLHVVAAENFWGSIASQLGGNRVQVNSVITSPATDPHDYEPTAADARTIAGARLVVVNGIGYDPWADKLIAANPVSGRIVLNVGDLVGIKPGGNPHRWYSPPDVQLMIDSIVLRLEVRLLLREVPGGLRLLRAAEDALRDEGARAVQAADRDDQAQVRRRARRRLGEHVRPPRASARAEDLDAADVPQGDQRGHRADRRGQDDDRPPDRTKADQGLGLQQSEQHPRRQ